MVDRVPPAEQLASVNDLTALVLVDVNDGSVHCFAWLPEEGLAEKSRLDKVEYAEWAKKGQLLTTPGRAVSYDHVAVEGRMGLEIHRPNALVKGGTSHIG